MHLPLVMSRQLCSLLVRSFPKICHPASDSNPIRCGDGWFEILSRGMAEIQDFCDLCSDGSRHPVQLVLEQVEERGGSLGFYYRVIGGTELEREIISDLVLALEQASLCFCELTGNSPALLCRRGSRLRTLCLESACQEGYEPYSVEGRNLFSENAWQNSVTSSPKKSRRKSFRGKKNGRDGAVKKKNW